ncbi:hypothetical protein Clacol_007286 [Clathrus columnatus]|uniref:Uncharacterized protein n=1 Tax=Clathrus columnatus TaxID=1419009 RepID=A0AAV5AEH5_9AGAM|nr:hypothetical protein Clacol_007286 [Clathrus columnatus]
MLSLRNRSQAILSRFRTYPVRSGYPHRTRRISEVASESFIQSKIIPIPTFHLHSPSIPTTQLLRNLRNSKRQYTTTQSPLPRTPVGDSDSKVVSDHEYNIRLGRATYTLETTLPTFFQTGLVSIAEPDDEVSLLSGTRKAGKPLQVEDVSESIYASNIRLSYTPPTAFSLPAAFPRTLQVEGLPLYHASAAFIRHTLSAFNMDLGLSLCKLTIRSLGARDRQIEVRTIISGKSRLSGALNEWDVHSTYTLSPQSGLIDLHVVESIQPAPHITFLDGLRGTLARLAGIDVERRATADGLHTQSKASS